MAAKDFVKLNKNGDAEITLAKPVKVSGALVSVLTMREPTVGDQMAAEATATGPAMEVQLFANLCGISKEEMLTVPMRSYQRVQAGYGLFLE